MIKMQTIKAVIPVAGYATRFLPQTKAMPKQMFPIVDKPIIQILVEELVKSEIKDIVLVTGWHKRAIEDHFDNHPELEALLEKTGKLKYLAEVKKVSELANFIYIRQKGPVGNATPIANVKSVIGNDPFIVCWGDEFIISDPPMGEQLMRVYEKYQGVILGAIRTTDPNDGARYGFAKGKQIEDGIIEVEEFVEKPGVGKAPSELATVAGFLYPPEICDYMKRAVDEATKEPYYVDGINLYMKETGKKVYAMEFKNSKYYDTGSKLGYLKTIVEFGKKHPEIGEDFKKWL